MDRTRPRMPWEDLADRVLEGKQVTHDDAHQILQSDDLGIIGLIAAAFRIRRAFFGTKVKLNYLINARSGACPEDCAYCSQSSRHHTDIATYPMLSVDEIVRGSDRAVSSRASTYCIVTSGRGPRSRDIDHICNAVAQIKHRHPDLKICACLGIIDKTQAKRLRQAGIDRYNHNLNTSQDHYPSICTTHSYQDRTQTVKAVRFSGLSPCSGLIVGMGESVDDVINLAFALRDLDADSIPVNFLIPIPGTPLGHPLVELTPQWCLKVLCMMRFVCSSKEIRVSAGRERHLRTLQPLSLYPANAIFIADYLTTSGQPPSLDCQMIEDLGFEIEPLGLDQIARETSGAAISR